MRMLVSTGTLTDAEPETTEAPEGIPGAAPLATVPGNVQANTTQLASSTSVRNAFELEPPIYTTQQVTHVTRREPVHQPIDSVIVR